MDWTRATVGRLAGVLLVTGAVCAVLVAGCGGGAAGSAAVPAAPSASPTVRSDIPNFHPTSEWITMIEEANFSDYAKLGSDMQAAGRVKIVSPPTLDENFNAYAFINTREIWINRPMFTRYPTVVEQATIFLHELIHIKSGELTHTGPWWSAQGEFYSYWTEREAASAVALADGAADGVAE